MKRSKILLVIMALFLLVSLTGCNDKHEHVYGDWEIVAAPTEDATGEAKKECECGDVITETIPALSDTTTWTVEVTESTCTVKGSKKYTSIYGEVIIELPLAEHEYGDWTITVEPTEDTAGKAEKTCKYGEKVTEEVAKLTDTKVWTVEVVESTCTKEGSKTYTSIYGTIVKVIEKKEHTFGEWTLTVKPTEDTAGKAERECSVCKEKETVEVAKLTDTKVWKVEVTEATCTKDGKKVYTSVYGTVEVVLPKLNHKFGDWKLTVNPTEEKVGTAERECSVCKEKETVEVAKLTDTKVWKVEVTEATCTKEGKKVYTSVYGTVEVVLPKLEHKFGNWTLTVEPTEDTAGKAERECSVGHEKETVEVAKLTDTTVWTLTTVDATCTKKGSKTYTSIYGTIVKEIAMKEHTYGEWTLTKEPTETEKGTAERECSVCHNKETVEVAVLTDTTVWTLTTVDATCTATGTNTYTSVYGKVVKEIAMKEHTYSEWTLTKEPTETETGTAERECSVCHNKETVEVAVLTDTTVWTVEAEKLPDYNIKGFRRFKSIYGTVGITLPKKVAPYDNKTYHSFALDAEGEGAGVFANGKVTIGTSWNTAELVLDGFGKGSSKSHPFRGYHEVKMVNEETGEVRIDVYEVVANPDTWEDEIDYSTLVSYKGFVDFESGIIVVPNKNSFSYVHVWTPFESGVNETKANASSWDNSIACEYTFNANTYKMYITNERVYFGVEYVDIEGNAITAGNCYNSPVVYVKQGEALLKAFVYNGTKLVEADGLEGTYTGTEGDIVLNGCGGITLNGVAGTYEVAAAEAEYSISAYVNNAYYEIALLDANKYLLNKPLVTVTLIGNLIPQQDHTVNKNIKFELPLLTNEENQFKGWFFDEACTQAVPAEFIPTADVTLYAKWAPKVVITIVGALAGDETTIKLGEGDVIGEYLPVYSLDAANRKKFVGWYLDETFETTLPEDAEVTAEDTGISIYAKWEDLPAYYGTYKGVEVYGQDAGNYSTYDLVIDENGKVSGNSKWTGIIDKYDPLTQTITYKENASATTTKKMIFDPEIGVIAIGYSGQQDLGSDYYIFMRDNEVGKVNSKFAIDVLKESGSGTGYYARFINLDTIKGNKDILVMYNHIYSNITITDTKGTVYTAKTINTSKTAVVKDATSGETILAYGSKGESFKANNNTVQLDAYFGTYTNGADTIVLDGMENVIYKDNITGTYKKQAVEGNTFDVYLNNNTEYYVLTLEGETFTLNKVMVEITFVMGEGHTALPAVQANKNVVMTLPEVTEEGYVFNGWFLDAEFKNSANGFTPIDNATLYAKFSNPAVLTIHYNNGSEDAVVTYSVNDIVTLEKPVFAGKAFIGWYTTATFDEGSEYVLGNPITVDTEIYAKWEDAPKYFNTFGGIELNGTKVSGTTGTSYKSTASFDEYGLVSKTGWYPFNGDAKFVEYNKVNGTMIFEKSGSRYNAFMSEDGYIVINQNSNNADMDEAWMLVPGEAENFVSRVESSYWLNGMARLVVYTDAATAKHNIFIYNNQVYFNVTFADLEGNEIASANNVYNNAKGVRIFASDKAMIAEFGLKDGELATLDGKQGTYKHDWKLSIILDGVGNITMNNRDVLTTGKYEIVDANNITAVVENTYYEIALNGANCTVVKPMVDLTFNPDGGTFAGLNPFAGKTFTGTYTHYNEYQEPEEGTAKLEFNDTLELAGTITFTPLTDYALSCNFTATFDGTKLVMTTSENGTIEATLAGDTFKVTSPSYITSEIRYDVKGSTMKLAGFNYATPTVSYNKNIEVALPTVTKEGFIFKGWKDGETVVADPYTPTANKTLVAYWKAAIDVTFVLGNGTPDAVVVTEEGTPAVITEPTFEGHIFMGWYTDAEFNTKYNNEAITTATTLYAKWIETPAYVGNYNGAELYNGFASKGKTLVINPDLTMDNTRTSGTGTILADTYDPETGVMSFTNANGTYKMFYKAFGGVDYVIINYSTSTSDAISGDIFVYIKDTITDAKVKTWDSNKQRFGFFVTANGTNVFYVNTETNEFVGNITIEDSEGTVLDYNTIGNASVIRVKANDGTVIKELGLKDNEFVELDGYQGTYKNNAETIVLNGAGIVTFGTEANAKTGTYEVIAENKVEVVLPTGAKKCYLLDKVAKTYVETADRTKGTYTNETNTFVSNGDGTCTFNGTAGTYTYNGNDVTFFVDGKATVITINADGTYLEKSVLAGYVFTGEFVAGQTWGGDMMGTIKIEFANTAELGGKLTVNCDEDYEWNNTQFTATFDGTNLVMNTTSYGVVKATLAGQTFTFTEGKVVYNLAKATVTCKEFTLPSAPVEKSILAGHVFKGTTMVDNYLEETTEEWTVKITFEDTADLKGNIEFSYAYSYDDPSVYTFTAVLKDNLVVMTITSSKDNGKLVKATIANETLTITEEAIGAFSFNGMVATCPGFIFSEEVFSFAGKTIVGTCDVADPYDSEGYGTVSRNVKITFDANEPLQGNINCEDYMSSTDYAFTAEYTGNVLVLKTANGNIEFTVDGNTLTRTSKENFDGHYLGTTFTIK